MTPIFRDRPVTLYVTGTDQYGRPVAETIDTVVLSLWSRLKRRLRRAYKHVHSVGFSG